jgi:muconolactone delta-isomerase
MLFLATARLVDSTDFERLRAAENAVAGQLTVEGIALATLIRADGDGFFLLGVADDLEGAAAAVARLPFIAHGVSQVIDICEIVAAPGNAIDLE